MSVTRKPNIVGTHPSNFESVTGIYKASPFLLDFTLFSRLNVEQTKVLLCWISYPQLFGDAQIAVTGVHGNPVEGPNLAVWIALLLLHNLYEAFGQRETVQHDWSVLESRVRTPCFVSPVNYSCSTQKARISK